MTSASRPSPSGPPNSGDISADSRQGSDARQRLKKKAVRGSFWSAAESWCRHLIAAAVFVVLGRLLGPEDFGLIALALLVVGLAELAVSDTFAEALVQRETLEAGHCDAAFWFVLAVAALLSLLLLAAAAPLALLLGDPRAEPLMQALSPVVLLSALATVPIALLRRKLHMRPLAWRSFVGLLAGGSVGIGMALAGFGVWSLVGQLLATKVMELALVWPAARWRPGLSFDLARFRELRSYGLPMIGLRLTLYVNVNLPRLFAGVVLGAASLGLLQIALRLTALVKASLLNPVAQMALPTTARVQGDPLLVARVLSSASRLTALMALPSLAGLSLVAPLLVPLLLGEQWRESVPAVQLLALAGVPAALNRVNSSVLRGLGHARWQLYLALGSFVLLAGGTAAVAPLGIDVIALAVLAATVAMWPVKLYVFHRVTGLDVIGQLRDLLPIFLSTVLMAGAVGLWQATVSPDLAPPLALLSEIAVGAATFALAILAMARSALRDCLQVLAAARGAARAA